MLRAVAISSLLCCAALHEASAQQASKSVAGKQSTPTIPGYQIHTIEGFNVLVSDETMQHQETDEFERKPLDVLSLELKTITQLMHPEAVAVLRKLIIWVQWNEQLPMANGRPNNSTAYYHPGSPQQMITEGRHPLQSKNVTINDMKLLTQVRQPKRDVGGCLLLHEMSHAVHDRFLGYDDPKVKAAYQQAMERKLYDSGLYVSTNEHEFFAELTCAYFDQLGYYPRTRADLQKHDPFTYQFMESLWGKRKTVAATTESAVTPTSETLKLRLEDVKLGTPVSGPTLTLDGLRGRPVLLVLWNAGNESSLAAFQKLKAWDAELSDFGLVTVADHWTGVRGNSAEARTASEARGVAFAVTEQTWINGDLIDDFQDFPLALVFDHAGRCVFRGSPFDAEPAIRGAVGTALTAKITSDSQPVPKGLTGIVDSLQKGKSPTIVLSLLSTQTRSPDAATAEAAKKLLTAAVAGAQTTLTEAEPLMSSDPVGAYMKIARLPTVFKGTPEAAKAMTMLAQLRRDKAVALEFLAQPALTMVNRLDAELGSKPYSFDPSLPQFRSANAVLLQQLQQVVAQMKQTWPTTRSTDYAVKTAGRYGLLIP